jgi:hypothetical protein
MPARRLTPPFGMAALFVGAIVGAALVFVGFIAEARGASRGAVIALFLVAVGGLVLFLARRAICRSRTKL